MKKPLLLFCFLLLVCSFCIHAQSITAKNNFLLTGDICFAETYQQNMEKKGTKYLLKNYGYDYFIEKLTPLLSHTSLIISNLETPITDLDSTPYPSTDKQWIHKADIIKTPEALKKHNIINVSLANNHTMDYGIDGMKQTLDILKRNSIRFFGAGLNHSEAAEPFRFTLSSGKKKLNVIIAGGLAYDKKYEEDYKFYASEKPGVNEFTPDAAGRQTSALRNSEPDAFIIAYPHCLENYEWKSDNETQLAHALIDAGADIVVGQGSHMFQEIELYKGKYILYSIGNFMFSSPGRYEKMKSHSYSLAAMFESSENNSKPALSLKLYPLQSNNKLTEFQSRPVTEEEMKEVAGLLRTHSFNINFDKDFKSGEDNNGRFLELQIR